MGLSFPQDSYIEGLAPTPLEIGIEKRVPANPTDLKKNVNLNVEGRAAIFLINPRYFNIFPSPRAAIPGNSSATPSRSPFRNP